VQGKIHTLVCTDVAARGIHIKRLQHVVNYDFPSNLEQYCHRVGRTGRQGAPGWSYSLVTRNMAPLARDLIALLKSTGQAIEPNLEALASEFLSGKFVFDTEDEHSGGPGMGMGDGDEES
jgi:superfamily II DNA/RNA helicase